MTDYWLSYIKPQVLCCRDSGGSGVSPHDGSCLQRPQAGKCARQRGRPHHAFGLRSFPQMRRGSQAPATKARPRSHWEEGEKLDTFLCYTHAASALLFLGLQQEKERFSQNNSSITSWWRPRNRSRIGGWTHQRSIQVLRRHPRVLSPGSDLRTRPWKCSGLVDSRGVLIRASLRKNTLQRWKQRKNPHQHFETALNLPKNWS